MTGTRFTVDSDGDVGMSIPQPIFEIIKAPELTSWEHAALIEWHREWERVYSEGLSEASDTEEYGQVRAKKPIASVTDADILGAVEARCRTLKNEFVPDVTSLFRANLKMNLSIDDCDARIFRYYEDFNGIVEDNGLQGLIGSENEGDPEFKSRMKARCRLLVDNLQPPVLKAQIGRLIELERRDCKSDDVALFDLILEHAKPQKTSGAKTGSPTTSPVASTTLGNKGSAAARKAHQQAGLPPTDGCLVFKGQHWLKDCPTATDSQREEALRKYQEAKAQKPVATRSKAARYAVTASSVRVNGVAETPYSPDTAADQSIIPQETLNALRAMQPTLQIMKLQVPVEAVMANGQTQICDEEVLLDLELTTVASLVVLRSEPCLVMAGDGEEFLLGREVLKGLGIDVDQLSQLAGSPILEDEVDEFPVGDEIPPSVDAAEDSNSIDLLLERAIANRLPDEHVEAFRDLLATFPDIWREGVGPDPPADVEPLRVTIPPGSVPYRSRPRKYAPLQAQIIRDYVKSLVTNNLVKPNNASRWACAVVPVRKPETNDKFRLTIDYRPVNNVTVPIAGAFRCVPA